MKFRYLAALVLTVLLLAIARRTSTRYAEEFTSNVDGITLSHKTLTESFGENPLLKLKASETTKERAVIFYKNQDETTYKSLEMQPNNGEFTANLDPLPKGQKYFYHINVYKDNIKLATFPPQKDQFIKFKGHIAHPVLVTHILLMFATIFFGLLAVFTAIDLARGKGNPKRAVLFLLLAFASAFIGGIPLGIAVSSQTFGGSGWGGWPLGTDITDTKTEVLLLFWLVTLALSWKALTGRQMAISNGLYAFLTILSFVVTFITFLIPHSI